METNIFAGLAMHVDPNHARAYYNQGVLLYNLGNPEEALSAFKQAARINPNYAYAYYNLLETVDYRADGELTISHDGCKLLETLR